ncbi:MAG TPA: hypothetical protein DCZ95_11505 [Verrucomicrobia bacterium]|nr:hypothetical protein [Verrucomicrobiota bacterium]
MWTVFSVNIKKMSLAGMKLLVAAGFLGVPCAGAAEQHLVGDWNGDGRDNIATRCASTVYMDFNYDGLPTSTWPETGTETGLTV